jgi:hypothetical protein
MDDSETEARRLLAVATTDMPPGIDLLEGFAAARQRDRARRTRTGAVLSAGIAVAAALVTALTLTTAGSAPSARAAVSSALTRTLTQSYHLTEQYSIYHISNGRVTHGPRYTCTSVADPVRHLEATSCPGGVEASVTRTVGRYRYGYIAVPMHGKHWVRIPVACPGQAAPANGFTTATPQQMLAEIKKAAKVTVAGPVSGPGWTGTQYAFSKTTPAAKNKQKLRGTVNVDKQGRARALVLTIALTGARQVSGETQFLTFSDFGTPVTVIPPPADQTFSRPC